MYYMISNVQQFSLKYTFQIIWTVSVYHSNYSQAWSEIHISEILCNTVFLNLTNYCKYIYRISPKIGPGLLFGNKAIFCKNMRMLNKPISFYLERWASIQVAHLHTPITFYASIFSLNICNKYYVQFNVNQFNSILLVI